MNKYLFIILSLFIYSAHTHGKTTIRYFATDAQGTVTAEFNESAINTAQYFYDAYGRELGSTHEGLGFIGSLYERDLDLLLLNERYYSPELKRFISNDPIAFDFNDTASFNRYSYARSNPLKYIDPTGLRASGSICDYNAFCYVANFVGHEISAPARFEQTPSDDNNNPRDGEVICDATCINIAEMMGHVQANQEAVAYYPGVAVTFVGGVLLSEYLIPAGINSAVGALVSQQYRPVVAAFLLEASGSSFTAAKGLNHIEFGEYYGKFEEAVWIYYRKSGFKTSLDKKDLKKGPGN